MTTPHPTISQWIPVQVLPKQGGATRIVYRYGRPLAHHHQTTKVKRNAKHLIQRMSMAAPPSPLEGPLAVKAVYMSPRRCRDSKALQAVTKVTRPDIDNLSKQLLDCIEAAEWIVDDSQVVELRAVKVACDCAGVWVAVTELPSKTDCAGMLLADYGMIPIRELNDGA